MHSRNPQPVLQYTLAGEFIKQHASVNAAGRAVGVSGAAILDCLKGKQKKAANSLWQKASNPIKPLPLTKAVGNAAKTVSCYNPTTGKLSQTFSALKEAARTIDSTPVDIRTAIKTGRKHREFRWAFGSEKRLPDFIAVSHPKTVTTINNHKKSSISALQREIKIMERYLALREKINLK